MAGLLDALSPHEWKRLDGLLDAALDTTGPAREAFLATLDPSDATRVQTLIARIEETSPIDRALALGGSIESGATIGSWVLGEPLGEGGSSVVFSAKHQSGEFDVEAALKLLRKGPGTAPFVERFRQERQILIGLRHPHIVRVLDGGTSEQGQPFYVMERITGSPVTTWAATVPLRQRLELLIKVCGAVDYAHQRLIVHCDLKPDNLIVDGDHTPWVLDFGIAKLMDGSEVTATGHRMLTPRWAAPEQVDGEPVTTATDVHALGLLLWAVVTGAHPRQGLTGSALIADVSRNPLPPPSQTTPAARGDLDAMVAKATAILPEDRYRGAAELAEDLQRHLDGDAVLARERAPLYQTWRWIRRHPTPVATALGILGLLGAWIGSAALQAAQLQQERDRAEQHAERTEETLNLLIGMLEAASPAQARGEELTAREVLDQGVRELAVHDGDSEIQGEVLLAVGRVQYAVGDTQQAAETLTRAVDLLAESKGPLHTTSLRAAFHLAQAEHALEKGSSLERAHAVLTALRDQPPSPLLATVLLGIAEMQADQKEMQATFTLAQEAATVFGAFQERRGQARAHAVAAFAGIRLEHEGARDDLESALDEMTEVLGTEMHPEVGDILHELALVTPGSEGQALARRSLNLKRKLYGESFTLATTLNNYGLYFEASDPGRAVAYLREATEVASRTRGPDHPETLNLFLNLGAVLVDAGRTEEGIEVLQEVIDHPNLPATTRERVLSYLDKAAQP